MPHHFSTEFDAFPSASVKLAFVGGTPPVYLIATVTVMTQLFFAQGFFCNKFSFQLLFVDPAVLKSLESKTKGTREPQPFVKSK